MSQIHRLPVAIVALVAASPAFAHDLPVPHSHAEWAIAAIALAGACATSFAIIRSRRRS